MAGKPVHVEIAATDSKRAMKFYGDLFGWEFQGFEGPVEYNMTRFSETSGGAIYPSEQGASVVVYYDVDDINKGAERVKELGGSTDEVMPIPGMGYSCHATDTESNRFGLFQSDESVQAPQG